MVLQPVFIEAEMFTVEKLEKLRYDPTVHLAIPYHRKMQYNGQTKERINGVDPYGMSGGPIWRFSEDRKLWLAGIGTEYDISRRLLKGTRFEEVLDLIQQQGIESWIRKKSDETELLVIDASITKSK